VILPIRQVLHEMIAKGCSLRNPADIVATGPNRGLEWQDISPVSQLFVEYGHVRFAPESRHGSAPLVCPLSAMCGRLRVGKGNLHVALLVGAAMCSAC
jgi:hypothetical protein